MGNDDHQYVEPDELFKQILFRDGEIVCRMSWKTRYKLFFPVLMAVGMLTAFLLMEEIEVPVLLSVVKPALAVSVVLFLLLFVSELRFPRDVRLRDDRLFVRSWFGKIQEAGVSEVNVYGLEPGRDCEIFTFTAPGFGFNLPSTMANIMPLIDAIETSNQDIGNETQPEPNWVVSGDRNPRSRGFRPLNNNR